MSFYIKSLLIFLIVTNIYGDEIYLTNNDRFSGQLISLSPSICVFSTQYQAILKIPRNKLFQLNTTSKVTVELYSGEILKGSLTKNGKLISSKFGKLPLKITDIKYINRTDNSKNSQITEIPDTTLAKLHARASVSPSNTPAKAENQFKISLPQSDMLFVKKGEQELGITASYTYDEFEGQRIRDFSFPLTWSIGLTDKLGFLVDLPISWVLQDNDDDFSKNKEFGIGDINLGLSYLLLPEKNNRPDIIGSLGITLPTGDEPDYSDTNKITLGNGHWEVSANLLTIKTYDPAILFGSIGYIHSFTNDFNEIEITPGDTFVYMLGAGFLLNRNLAFFSQIEGSYQTETKRNGMKIPSSDKDEILIREYVSYSLGSNHYIQPTISFGITDASPDFIFDFSYLYRF